jgi:polyisoprenoid-binding protein YceI
MTIATTTQETAVPTTETWAIDPAHTQVGFAVKHLMITNVKGRFREVSGSIRLDPTTMKPEVDVSIGAASITTGDDKRDAHLASADFLHADKFPVIQFRGRRVEGDLDARFALHGDLLIRGVTRPVTVSVVNEGRVTDPWGNERVGYTASASINRKDFGLEWNMALEAGGVLVGDEVKITIETELVRQ